MNEQQGSEANKDLYERYRVLTDPDGYISGLPKDAEAVRAALRERPFESLWDQSGFAVDALKVLVSGDVPGALPHLYNSKGDLIAWIDRSGQSVRSLELFGPSQLKLQLDCSDPLSFKLHLFVADAMLYLLEDGGTMRRCLASLAP